MDENTNTPKSDILMPTGEALVVSSSPHLSSPERTSHIMGKVLLALAFPAAAGIWFFGLPALRVIFLTVFFCIGAEALWCRLAGKPVKNTICNLAVYYNEKSSLYATPRMRSWQEIEEYAERDSKILYIFNGRRLVRIIKPSTFKEDKYV